MSLTPVLLSPVFFHDLAFRARALTPNAVALSVGAQHCRYAQLWDRAQFLANRLRQAGLVAGERVALYLEKRIETVEAFLAISLAGGVFVPINPVLKPAQVAHIVHDCQAAFLMTQATRLEGLRAHPLWTPLPSCLRRVFVLMADAPAPSSLPPYGDERCAAWPLDALPCLPPDEQHTGLGDDNNNSHDDPHHPAHLRQRLGRTESDLAALFYTSGSTGHPKGVMLSHRNLVAGAQSVAGYLQNTPDDVLLAALPLSFDAGFSQLSTAFAVGARVHLLNYLLPRDIVRTVAREKVTGLTAVAPLWIQLAGLDWGQAGASLRYFANTGGRLPRHSLQALRACLPQARPFLMYGLTEAFRATYLDPAFVDERPDSIGKAIPNAEIKVLGEDGRPCAPGVPGELVQRGPLVAMGYWNDPVRTAQRFRPLPACALPHAHLGQSLPEYAVFSGDTVVCDEDGFLYFVGRNDAMIKTSGYRISPEEIEEVVYGTGLVAEAAAFGLADEALGQVIALIVCPKPSPETRPENEEKNKEDDGDWARAFTARLLAALALVLPAYMRPAHVYVRTEPLPRNPNGKLDRPCLPGLVDL